MKKTADTDIPNVWNFSGGLTSALMTIRGYKPGDIVLFTDTKREHDKTYKFLNDFEAHENIPVTRISYPGGFSAAIREKGYGRVPNRVERFCTKHLKVVTAHHYLRNDLQIRRYNNFIGFRADEKRRVIDYKPRYTNALPKFPLYDQGITKAHVNDYWSRKPYTLEIPHILGNCDLCFMKGKNAIIAILTVYPEFATKWIADEKEVGGTFIKGISYQTMLDIASNNIFKDYNIEDIKPAFNCSCTT